MPDSPNKLSQFWQELKRRKVLRSLAIYAGTSFIILEASSIIFPLWNFPEWSINLVLWLLILGAFINVIIAWIYDITPGGMRRTKPMEEVTPEERIPDSRGWKAATYISLVVIVALVILNLVPTKTLRAGDIQSLVILPFENYTGDEQLDILISGMHSMLINDVGRISEIRVISKTTSDVYKDVDMTIPQIASERKVDALMEIGVLCMGDTICFQLKVVTPDEEQLWITEYRVEKSQILNLNNEITRQIADEIMVELTPEEERLLDRDRTVDREAYDAYLRSHQYWDDLSLEGLNKALEYLNLAIEKDPDWAPLYDGLAKVWGGRKQMGFVSPDIAMPLIFEYLNKAIELDPKFAGSHFTSAIFGVWAEWNWEKGETEFKKALTINPSDAMSRIFYAHLLMILQRFDEALIQGRIAVELDPMNPLILALFAPVLISLEEWEDALGYLEVALEIDPTNHFALGNFDLIAYRCKEFEKAFEALKMTMPFEDDVKQNMEEIFREQGIEAVYEELNHLMEIKAQKEYVSFFEFAVRYMILNQNDKALDWFEIGLQFQDPNMPYITTGFFDKTHLYDNPRFIAILEKMNLPLPIN